MWGRSSDLSEEENGNAHRLKSEDRPINTPTHKYHKYMNKYERELDAIEESLKKGVAPQPERVWSLLLWFGAERRGYRVVHRIRTALKKHAIMT